MQEETLENSHCVHLNVNFAEPRNFGKIIKSDLVETLFPDDPFKEIRNAPPKKRFLKGLQYFVPIFEWLPNYNLKLLRYDVLAGITIASLAIPQGISYANLGKIPPIIGLYSSFVPPFIYAIFGSSKSIAVGTVASCSLIIAETIGAKVSPTDNLKLYLQLVFTATFITGILQTALGVLRLGFLVDFLSHSTITGFMGGTAVIISLQQLKGILGITHFTTKTDVVSVLKTVILRRHEWHWQSALVGIIFLAFLHFTKYLKTKKPKLFWISAMAPLVTVVVGGLFAYFAHAEKYGIHVVGPLKRGINPLTIKELNFDPKYISAPIQAGVITAILALAEGIAIGRSFAIMQNQQTDGNKEMIAFGLMNIVGSFTSCYLTTGPFSKTAVNYNAGCKTQMSNVVMAIIMLLTLLLLAPLFSYTPMVALSAIIMSAMFGLIEYDKFYHLYKVDKFDFCICMVAFLGVSFVNMDTGLALSVGLGIIRTLLYTARPSTCKLANIPNTNLYRDVEQYPVSSPNIPGILVIQLGSPIFYTNSGYIRERMAEDTLVALRCFYGGKFEVVDGNITYSEGALTLKFGIWLCSYKYADVVAMGKKLMDDKPFEVWYPKFGRDFNNGGIKLCCEEEKFLLAYEHSISPMPGVKQWEKTSNPQPLPPPFRKLPGRPSSKKRRKEPGEEQSKHVKRPRKSNKCGKCGGRGHNVKTCTNLAAAPKPKEKGGRPPKNTTWVKAANDRQARRKASLTCQAPSTLTPTGSQPSSQQQTQPQTSHGSSQHDSTPQTQ